jgi:hypothetical protein
MPLKASTAQKNVARRIVLFAITHSSARSKLWPVPSHLTKHFKRYWQRKGLGIHTHFSRRTSILSRRPCVVRSKVHVSCLAKIFNTIFKNFEEEFFMFDKFCKLRQATTDRERKALFRFFNRFWSVFAGLVYGIVRKQNSSFQRQETPMD